MRRVTNEVVWAGVVAIVCGIVIASLLGGAGTPWWLVLATVGAGLVVTVVRSRLAARAVRDTNAPPPVTEQHDEVTPERRAVEAASHTAVLRARDAESHRRAGARSQSLRTGPPPRRKGDPSK